MTRALIAGICIAAFMLGSAHGQPASRAPAASPEGFREHARLVRAQTDAAQERRAKIDRELEAIKADPPASPAWAKEWAGVYVPSDSGGFGSRVMALAPVAGLAYIDRTDVGISDLNHGDIVGEVDGGVRVQLAIDPAIAHNPAVSETIYFVRWGERRYLVPECRMEAFCRSYNAAAGFTSDAIERFPLHADDHRKPEGGIPAVPEQYAARILKGPVEASIVSVENARVDRAIASGSAVLSKGSASGLYPGMKVWYRDDTVRSLLIESVTEHTATASFSFEGTPLGPAEPPKPGQGVSTRRP